MINRKSRLTVLLLSPLCLLFGLSQDPVKAMLDEINRDFAETVDYTGHEKLDKEVMQALQHVPRHAFVPQETQHRAYVNRPMSIGYGQTISQPFIVALMTQALQPQATDKVLEIGTGSGYQAAVLSVLVEAVYTVEIVPELAASAEQRLKELGYDNVSVRAGDGWAGWPAAAPFDAIIVTAAGPEIPPTLLEQLKPGGRLIMPVGEHNGGQNLTVVEKDQTGTITQRSMLPVMFVPLTGGPERE